MSTEDFRRACKVVLQATVCSDPILKLNVHREMMSVFAAQLRYGQSVNDIIDFVIKKDVDECISNVHLQDGFFELLHVVLNYSDEVQVNFNFFDNMVFDDDFLRVRYQGKSYFIGQAIKFCEIHFFCNLVLFNLKKNYSVKSVF